MPASAFDDVVESVRAALNAKRAELSERSAAIEAASTKILAIVRARPGEFSKANDLVKAARVSTGNGLRAERT